MSIWTKRNKLNQIALNKQKEFPELVCTEKIINPANKESVLVDVGDKVRIERTENKDFEGKELYLVSSKEKGYLFLNKEEILKWFDCSEVNLNNVPYHQVGFKIDKEHFRETTEEKKGVNNA